MQSRKSLVPFWSLRNGPGSWLKALAVGATIVQAAAGKSSDEGMVLGADGKSDYAIIVAAEDLGDNSKPKPGAAARAQATYQRWLRESVNDFQRVLEAMTGAKLPIETIPPGGEIPKRGIIIGTAAERVFGEVGKSAPDKQAYRVIAQNDRLGLYGESPLATVYAIYDLLQQVGCRWFVPGDIGECLPELPSRRLVVAAQDRSEAPATIYRGVWFSDEAFRRRNRLREAFDRIEGAHALENYITQEQRTANPSWCALIDGKRDPARKQLAWGNTAVSDAIAESILAKLRKTSAPSVSLSPLDQIRFSEGPEDKAMDAGVWDETMQTTAISDRLITFANRIVGRVKSEFPDTRFGLLAYHHYVQPPVREKPDPNIVPLIAPITYNRIHSMLDDRIESSRGLRTLIEGWGKLAPTAFRGYSFNLAEPMAPFPQITRYSKDIPYIVGSNMRYWQTETFPNFESTMYGIYLSIRLTWDPAQDPADIVRDLNHRFYGPAEKPMSEYWDLWDKAWDQSTNLAGSAYGYLDRFPESFLKQARKLLAAAKKDGSSEPYAARIQLAQDSFSLFEEFMGLLRNLQSGDLANLGPQSKTYRKRLEELGSKYGEYFFSKKFALRYFDRFWREPLAQATTISTDSNHLIAPPLTSFRMAPDSANNGLINRWYEPDFSEDESWREIEVGLEQWNQKGFMNYFGPMWYRTTVDLSKWRPGPQKSTRLWVPLFDDEVSVFVNGKQATPLGNSQQDSPAAKGFCKPATFDTTGLLEEGKVNQITLRTVRNRINELGTGGLLAPVFLYGF